MLIAVMIFSLAAPVSAATVSSNPGANLPARQVLQAYDPTATRIEEGVSQALTANGTADFIVDMVEQADLSPAYSMTDWNARGEWVYQTLLETAARSQKAVIAYLDGQGLKHQSFFNGNEVYVYGGSLKTVQTFAAMPEVGRMRRPVTVYLDEPVLKAVGPEQASPQAITDWGITDTNAPTFWGTFGVKGDGILVANIDTGVQWNHPALVNQFKCPGQPDNPACWYDPTNSCGAGGACDDKGHGTHTMGTMVAKDDASLAYIAGMAPNAKWIACKACDISGSCSEASLNSCADWILAPGGSAANRPDIVNNSWGSGGGDAWYQAKVQAWRAAGIFPAFSAGNHGSSCDTIGDPGDYQESFASAAHDNTRTIAGFSSRGPSPFGDTLYTKPNISAPGVSICSTVPTNGWSCGYSGTSMASPHTAGAVALLWSCNPALKGQIDLTFQVLQNDTDAPPDGNCSAPPSGHGNYTFGYGYLNVLKAGNAICTTLSVPSSLAAFGVTKVRINLRWTDNSSGETGFKIERSPDGATGWVQIGTVGTNVKTYADKGLTTNATYYYRVRAYNAGGNSDYSNVAHATTPLFIFWLPSLAR